MPPTDLLTIALSQLNELPEGPKIIAGDFNGTVDALGTLQNLLLPSEGLTDVGMDERICKGITGQYRCHANADAKESRIDFILTNRWLTPALENGRVDKCDLLKTHKPFKVDIRLTKLKQTLKEMQPVTNYATMIEDMIPKKIDEEKS